MPEIKNNFTGGKMNKDLDERLIPNGQYKDALNIQVSTSEGSDVGTVQNILGNKLFNSQLFDNIASPQCIGSIADEKNDTLYWFVHASNGDFIFRYSDANGIQMVVADPEKKALKFQPNNIITGINIIDDLLLWTDNNSEPKKINISRCIEGTNQNQPGTQTLMINYSLNYQQGGAYTYKLREKHITVIRKAPYKPLSLEFFTGRDPNLVYTGVCHITSDPGLNQNTSSFTAESSDLYDFSSFQIGDIFEIQLDTDINGNVDFNLQDWEIGKKIVLKEYTDSGNAPAIPITDYRIRGVLIPWEDTDPNNPCDDAFHRPGQTGPNYSPALYTVSGRDCNRFFADSSVPGYNPTAAFPANIIGSSIFKVQITSIDGFPPAVIDNVDRNYVIDLFDETEKLFEFRLPRFSYRYKYADGEYSTFAPWSEIAFVPGSFDYHPKKGFNLGMTNRLVSLTVSGFSNPNSEIPKDVVSIDILYKEENNANVYLVETIKPEDAVQQNASNNAWYSDSYHITSETIHSVLPSNQTLRPWDNVPRKALAQEITGNRVVYGNYIQNYNLKAGSTNSDYYPDFNVVIDQFETSPTNAVKSIKSLREYQLGVTFIDEYGRETPVITSPSGTFKLDKTYSSSYNRIKVGFNQENYPENMKWMKFYVKETSGEYYNMAMDRYYDADDGNVWLAFPSSDRNKVDIDTFLILKKAVDSDQQITEPARFKILAIEDKAPDFVKQNKILVESKTHSLADVATNINYVDIFGNGMTNVPALGTDYFEINYEPFFMSSGGNLHEITQGLIQDQLYVEFTTTEGDETSNRYRISNITCTYKEELNNLSSSKYNIKIEESFGNDINFISDDPTGLNSTKIIDTAQINIYKYRVENRPQFDGRFFVKILNDDVFRKYIRKVFQDNKNDFKVVASNKVNYFKNSFHKLATNPLINRFDLPALTTGATTSTALGTALTSSGAFSSNAIYNPFAPSKHHFQAWFQDFHFTDDNGAAQPWSSAIGGQTGAPHKLNYYEQYGWTMYYPIAHPDATYAHDVFRAEPPATNWFVDYGGYHAYSLDNDLYGRYGGFNSPGLGNVGFKEPNTGGSYGYKEELKGRGKGIVNNVPGNKWSMDLSFGGILSKDWTWDGNEYEKIEQFFNIGREGGNINHVNEGDFASKLLPGAKVRWREDPTETIYTIKSGVGEHQRLRYFSGSGNQNADSNSQFGNDAVSGQWSAMHFDPDYVKDDPNEYDNPGKGGYHENIGFTNPANFTKTWDITFEPSLVWDPTTNGIIPNGHNIQIDEANVSINIPTPFDPNNVYIQIDTLIGECQNIGGDFPIAPGMMVTHYNDGTSWPNTPTTPASCGFAGGGPVIKEIKYDEINEVYQLYLAGYNNTLSAADVNISMVAAQYLTFQQPGMNHLSETFVKNFHKQINKEGEIHVIDVGYTLDILEPVDPKEVLPDDPAIWETEPKEIADLNLYYEASGLLPLEYNEKNDGYPIIPLPSYIVISGSNTEYVVESVSYENGTMQLNFPSGNNFTSLLLATSMSSPKDATITTSYGLKFDCKAYWPGSVNTSPTAKNFILIKNTPYLNQYHLNWYNCYSFGNGVESNRIRDNFNLPFIANGVKASTTLEEEYTEERRKYGLIYSGIYNSISGVNNLNQFIQAEKITKDVNPIYGSIQKLHSRNTDLVTMCEDKILKILANKDAVFNADGNPQLTATNNVLGQTIPFSGEYGISTNPESFASESYRVYFSDKVRGSVLRLSMDGLTPISSYGMKDWFKDNLKLGDKIIGSYDDKKDEYNITIIE